MTRPSDEYMWAVEDCVWQNFPKLRKYENDILVIFACTETTSTIIWRSVEDIVDEVRRFHKQGKKYFIFQNAAECVLTWILHKCQLVVEKCKEIPSENFFFHSSGLESEKVYEEMCRVRGWTRPMRMLISNNHEWVINKYLKAYRQNFLDNKDIEYAIKLKNKKFVCFNKVHRGHRIKLLSKMLMTNLVDKGYYSFVGSPVYPVWVNDFIRNRPKMFTDAEILTIEENRKRFPMILNTTEQRHNPIDIMPDDMIYHEDSYFSIVTETMFYKKHELGWHMGLTSAEDDMFISEKTYRPLGLKHPFILAGLPHTLKYLREAGYKTFHPYIDESYDDIENGDDRMDAIIKEIRRLCAFTDEQWLQWQTNIKPIVDHNYNNLLSKTDFSYKDYEHCFNR